MKFSNDSVLQVFFEYADKDDNIRGILLEGSRAFGSVDQYSDYDIVLVTKSSEPYFNSAFLPFLIEHFGEIAVMQTPDNGDPHDVYTHLIQFASGVRIDLTFNSLDFLNRTPLESATIVLMDKDAFFTEIISPSDSDFWVKKPSEETFCQHCNEFWWCSPYVAKAICRGQTLHALELLSECIRTEYVFMLSCLIGIRYNWNSLNLGKHNTNMEKIFLPEDMLYLDALMESYVNADNTQIRYALNNLMEKFHAIALFVSGALNYGYDNAEAEKTIKFVSEKYFV